MATSITTKNLVIDPRLASGTVANWSLSYYVTPTRVASGGPNADIPAFSRSTLVAPASGARQEIIGTISNEPITSGAQYTFSAWARTSLSDIEVAGVSTGGVYSPGGSGQGFWRSPYRPLPANTWLQIIWQQQYIFGSGDRYDLEGIGPSFRRTGGGVMQPGTYDATGGVAVLDLIPEKPYSGNYFDGAMPPLTYTAFSWQGTANASPSIMVQSFPDPLVPSVIAEIRVID